MVNMHRMLRALSASAAVLLAAGCASSVVQGSGSAGPSSPSTSSSTTSSSSTSISSGTTTPTSSGPTSLPATSVVINKAGHYSVRLPGTPIRKTEPGSSSGVHYTVRLDVLASPYLALVGAEDFDVNLPVDQIDTALDAAIHSFQGSSGTTLGSDNQTTFRGRKARQADLLRGTQHYTMLVVAWSSHRLYFFFAPQGAPFDDLTGSFETVD
jgi:transposase InsO family protein